MAAKNLHRKDDKGIYSHIYNKGVDKRIIFNDEEDYEVFKGFLRDYLTAPQDPEKIKKAFTVHGRVFRGMPHQPKNYFNKVELMAYSLMPDHFHLLLHQKTRGSLESFIRSLCTRYSIYFNKKYQRTGGLFEGPYKSVQINDEPRLLHLTHYLHHTGDYSSHAEYLGTRVTSWVKPDVVLSLLDKEAGNYKDFVEKYQFDQQGKELIKGITFESETQHLERRGLARNVKNFPLEIPTESSEKIFLDQNLPPSRRVPEFVATAIVFIFLSALGIRNILIYSIKNSTSYPVPSVLSEISTVEEVSTPSASSVPSEISTVAEVSTPSASSVPSEISTVAEVSTASAKVEKPKILLTINIGTGSAFVNIRQKPTTNSEKISKAKNGDTFEFLSFDSGWYEVKLATGSAGFISEQYIKIGEISN